MSKIKLVHKIVPIFLIASILFTACDVPDISEFTTQSAEMTRGIRKGVKDTGDVLKNASERDDLFGEKTRDRFKSEAEKYQRVMIPSLNTLDSLDGYLEALNALSKANKKAGDNSKALVGAVGNLVTAASGITLATSAINIASGILAAGEKFKTAKSFKDRVNAATEIVEGKYLEITDPKTKQIIAIEKICTADSKNKIEDETKMLARNIENNIVNPRIDTLASVDEVGKITNGLFDDETAKLKENLSSNYINQIVQQFSQEKKKKYDGLTQTEKDKFLEVELRNSNKTERQETIEDWKVEINKLAAANQQSVKDTWKTLLKKRPLNIKLQILLATELLIKADTDAIQAAQKASDANMSGLGCGVIDLLKFTIEDLKVINSRALSLMARNSDDKNDVVLRYYDGIVSNDNRTQNELRFILEYKDLISSLREKDQSNPPITDHMKKVRDKLNNIFILDGQLRKTVQTNLQTPGCICGEMKDFLTATIDNSFQLSIDNTEWINGTSTIESDLETRATGLYTDNQKYLAELERIKPSHKEATDEIAGFENKQIQMNKLLNASIVALNNWTKAHANLRVTLNTKKPLTISALVASVKEIWAIINPKETE